MTHVSLRNVRKQRGWNQKELARHLGVSQTLVSFWEQGTRKVPRGRLQQLRQFGVDLDATELPMLGKPSLAQVDYAQALSNLGYRTFSKW
jgi:transcriptional regulator with XRE-family HTH domain